MRLFLMPKSQILSNGTSYLSISLAKRKYTRKPVPLIAARLLCYRDTLTHLIATLQEISKHFSFCSC